MQEQQISNVTIPDGSDIVIPTKLEPLQWPAYSFSKTVNALQIKSISEPVANDIGIKMTTIDFTDTDQPSVQVMPLFLSMHDPKEGDYLVLIDNVIHCLEKEFFESRTKLAIVSEEDTHS